MNNLKAQEYKSCRMNKILKINFNPENIYNINHRYNDLYNNVHALSEPKSRKVRSFVR